MLVFPREDAQSDAFWWAAERGGYSCDVVVGAAPAFECFVQKHHEVSKEVSVCTYNVVTSLPMRMTECMERPVTGG